jgi:hypothetical protein
MRFLFIFLIFIGCSYKTTPVIVAFKKDNLAINDQGFLKENYFSKKIEVYNVGQLVFVLTIKDKFICINEKCYDKKLFIHKLNPHYPTNLFSLIIEKKPIANIKIKKLKNGFIQTTDTFKYIVTDKKVLFKDKKNNFLFLLKQTQNPQ